MTIRTPDDEKPAPWYMPPFREGWHYQGATYAGHSDFSVDWNRRTASGGWLDDAGDPVLASADGTVAEVDVRNGLVMLDHGRLNRTESRHMTGIPVKVGQKVRRGDRIGSIGNVAGDGRSFGAHLHAVHWGRAKATDPWKRVKMRFEGKPVATSVGDSDTRPEGWDPPPPVMVEGPPPRATWEGAYREAAKALDRVTRQRDDARDQVALFREERDTARAELALRTTAADELRTALTACRARVAELENGCTALVDSEINREVENILAWVALRKRGVVT